ncbi:hypothetical protein [Micromonospora sp. IBHARD004]|uniref:hypothetical protein n=1 Tax=Micromonospora sp. IBHARD004 TaxID=3457764 RepID=UPI004059F1A9
MTVREQGQRYPDRKKASISEKVPFEELQWFFDCTVDSAGPGEENVVWVQLSCPDNFEGLWFTAIPENGDRVLITVLSVMQNRWRCEVAVSSTDGGEIYRIHPRVDT